MLARPSAPNVFSPSLSQNLSCRQEQGSVPLWMAKIQPGGPHRDPQQPPETNVLTHVCRIVLTLTRPPQPHKSKGCPSPGHLATRLGTPDSL